MAFEDESRTEHPELGWAMLDEQPNNEEGQPSPQLPPSPSVSPEQIDLPPHGGEPVTQAPDFTRKTPLVDVAPALLQKVGDLSPQDLHEVPGKVPATQSTEYGGWTPPTPGELPTPAGSHRNRKRWVSAVLTGALLTGGATAAKMELFNSDGPNPLADLQTTSNSSSPSQPPISTPSENTPTTIPNLDTVPALPGVGVEQQDSQENPQVAAQNFLTSLIDNDPVGGYTYTGKEFRQTFSLAAWESYVAQHNFAYKGGQFTFAHENTDDITQGLYSLVANSRSARGLPPLPEDPYKGQVIKTVYYNFQGPESKNTLSILTVQENGKWLVADFSNQPIGSN